MQGALPNQVSVFWQAFDKGYLPQYFLIFINKNSCFLLLGEFRKVEIIEMQEEDKQNENPRKQTLQKSSI